MTASELFHNTGLAEARLDSLTNGMLAPASEG